MQNLVCRQDYSVDCEHSGSYHDQSSASFVPADLRDSIEVIETVVNLKFPGSV